MYFIFESQICNWRNSTLQAILQEPLPTFQPHWWLAQPFISIPPSLNFSIHAKAPKPDNYFTGTLLIELYSLRLVELLTRAGVHHETLSVTMIDRKTKATLPIEYKAFHLLEIYPYWNREHSIVDDKFRIKKLLLTNACLTAKRPFFRLEQLYLTLIHENLKVILDEAGITGCTYTPVDEYRHRDFYEF